MDQHVISAWHLKAFARRSREGRMLAYFDKADGSFGEISVRCFLAETDAHSQAVEEALWPRGGRDAGLLRDYFT